ncbi:UDP-N-acetyl-D-glucosamine 2-epimerase, UDP-hydrolysing [Candidatus Falkowbacteria bacterium RIFCSPLOWO2_12_FULL_45_13]|uniref:UDP-N-acetyl-D-glucosamine 2-epimerase, UDP-hydrolysing n=2 Tax=Candidatus Falkowiibacteriota TaxID=1752728 RepID=A0A1F5SCE3_9BACT|nr:MAG: UDP-N-acetyl-D-glucosamine 2-epimerase, UDP-hydrolysing [Candidatus Falkowbacteria bacterium RIFCSPLOWO2_02_FULL_45_21]OGF31286.1 MAG: UDP-N-acetyl-D-glucosamine 2-epimerase, UDP-hydrolysing [Candidatus Falkowbacteria bacterium RIFCSPLOWO2_12_FULL_45_13]
MLNKIKKIAYVTGSRADFGLMTPVLKAIKCSKKLRLKLYATGEHLLTEFGATIKQVQREFADVSRIEATFKQDDRAGMAGFAAEFLPKLTAALKEDQPDFMLTLGDRAEMLCVATACLYLGIPTGHIHGGEKTFTVDELARHAITKLSSLHFPATPESAQRIIKMGEEPRRVKVVGAPAMDVILKEKLSDRPELFQQLGLKPEKKVILLTLHPLPEEWQRADRQIKASLAAVKSFGLEVAVIYPHADPGGRKMIKQINREKNNQHFHIFSSLPHRQFLALARQAAVWVGNSSAAMIESAAFKVPVVNVGQRQTGRQRGANVIDANYNRKTIVRAIEKSLYDREYLRKLKKTTNPWGDGRAGLRIVKVLERLENSEKLLKKQITY